MEKSLIVKNTIAIDAPAEKVWHALTDPEETKKYMFGCSAISDWKVGSSLIWKGVFNGQELIAVKGDITAIEKNRLLAYTVFDPNSTMPDIPENYTTVTYSLSEENGQTTLVVTQGDFATVAEGERRYKETTEGGGWDPILQQIKTMVE